MIFKKSHSVLYVFLLLAFFGVLHRLSVKNINFVYLYIVQSSNRVNFVVDKRINWFRPKGAFGTWKIMLNKFTAYDRNFYIMSSVSGRVFNLWCKFKTVHIMLITVHIMLITAHIMLAGLFENTFSLVFHLLSAGVLINCLKIGSLKVAFPFSDKSGALLTGCQPLTSRRYQCRASRSAFHG